MKSLIQLADDPSVTDEVRLLGEDDGQQIPILSYVVARVADGDYFAQTNTMRRNLNLSARNEFDPASLAGALKVLTPKSGYDKEAIWRTAEYYNAKLLAHEIAGKIGAPMTRPGAGTPYQLASGAEICHFTSLPETGWSVGRLSHVQDENGKPIPIRITAHMLCHHFLVGGTIGHGKTNLMGGVCCAALEAGFVPIIYDHKPDYILAKEKNPAAIGGGYGIKNAQIWTLGGDGPNSIYVPACELMEDGGGLLAATIFYRQGEELMAEMFTVILAGFVASLNDPQQKWGWTDFIKWFDKFPNAKALAKELPSEVELRADTYQAINRRIRVPARVPKWIRGSQAGFTFQQPITDRVNFFDAIQLGTAHVIRLDGERDSRGYALFLDYCLNRFAQMRKNGGAPIFNLVDEASDLFKSGNRVLREASCNILVDHVRKGRSRKIGFAFSTQSAGDCPPELLQNLNSVIAFKHKNPSVLKQILPEQASDIFGLVNNLRPGEALAQLHGVRSLLHCTMYLSPFKLYDPDEE